MGKSIEWMCTQCGAKQVKTETNGRPQPGVCPRSPSKKAHRWVKNKTIGN